MAGCDHGPDDHGPGEVERSFRGVLWVAFAVNAGMFGIEAAAGLIARSVALQADAIDFFSDATSYAVTLFVLGMGAAARANAALFKGATMAVFGLWVLGSAGHHLLSGTLPEPVIMGPVALLAFAANVSVAILLFRHREGDSNRRSIWLCSRNDAIANILVLIAAAGVLATGDGWPDIAVATIIAYLNLAASWRIVRHAQAELAAHRRGARIAAEAAD
ncbi:MAG: cation transporter [Dongiaceae bacterium]